VKWLPLPFPLPLFRARAAFPKWRRCELFVVMEAATDFLRAPHTFTLPDVDIEIVIFH
jgi:hypothetical protein